MVTAIFACASPGTISRLQSRIQFRLLSAFGSSTPSLLPVSDVAFRSPYCCPRPFRVEILESSILRASPHFFDDGNLSIFKDYSLFGAKYCEDVMIQNCGA